MNLPDLIGPLVNAEPELSQKRRAILWCRDDLLSLAVGSFLKSTDWDVIRVSNDGNAENLIREIKCVHPEVIILCRYEADNSTLALRLIDGQCCLKVITIGLDSNQMQVYSKQSLLLQKASDLLSVIEKENFSGRILEKEAV